MKQAIVFVFLLFTSSYARAQGIGDSLIVNLKNGQRVAIPLSEIRKITFDTLTAAVTPLDKIPVGLSVSPSFPNPSRTGTNIDFDIGTAGNATIAIYDSKGNPVRTLRVQNAQAGHHRVMWDGLDELGATVGSGAYFYEVKFRGEAMVKQMVIIK